MTELEALGQAQTRQIFINHGAPATTFGVKVEQLKTLQKRIRKDHDLSLALFATGHPDAQYLAGLIADEQLIDAGNLRQWALTASWHLISEYTVAGVAAGSGHGWQLAREWIYDVQPKLQATGWATLASLLTLTPDAQLDKAWLLHLLQLAPTLMDAAADRVRYTLNGFVIACGCAVPDLTEPALSAARMMGTISVGMGKTACKVPDALVYIQKCQAKGGVGKQKKRI